MNKATEQNPTLVIAGRSAKVRPVTIRDRAEAHSAALVWCLGNGHIAHGQGYLEIVCAALLTRVCVADPCLTLDDVMDAEGSEVAAAVAMLKAVGP